jgi:hypothetical protein
MWRKKEASFNLRFTFVGFFFFLEAQLGSELFPLIGFRLFWPQEKRAFMT